MHDLESSILQLLPLAILLQEVNDPHSVVNVFVFNALELYVTGIVALLQTFP